VSSGSSRRPTLTAPHHRDMIKKLTDIQISTTLAVALYTCLRLFSFVSYEHTTGQTIIGVFLIGCFLVLCTKKLPLAWVVLVGELLLDGSGHFFEIQGLILRTWFLGIFGIVWFVRAITYKTFFTSIPRNVQKGMIVMGIVLMWSIINGFLNQHSTMNILQDGMLYVFFLLLFPASEFRQTLRDYSPALIKGYLIGTAFFSLITFSIYASGIGTLPDIFYHWFRNVASGKITDLGNNFFRVVLPEHLLLIPIILIVTAFLIQKPKEKTLWVLLLSGLFVLTLNFSRIYIIALFAGILILGIKETFSRWAKIAFAIPLIFVSIFFSLHLLASHGQSLGLELLGFKVNGVTTMRDDPSGAIRLAILPVAIDTIKQHPWLGNGLGTTITYVDPTMNVSTTRTQFDFGYLEMLAELGIVGTIIFLFFLGSILFPVARYAWGSQKKIYHNQTLMRGILAGSCALFVINLTTPALFQGFGILFFIFAIVMTIPENDETVRRSTLADS